MGNHINPESNDLGIRGRTPKYNDDLYGPHSNELLASVAYLDARGVVVLLFTSCSPAGKLASSS